MEELSRLKVGLFSVDFNACRDQFKGLPNKYLILKPMF